MTSALRGVDVLLLEDESLVLMSTQEVLEGWGCSVRGFTHPDPCFAAVEERLPDIGVLDVKVNGHSYDLAELLDQRSVPIVFLTAYEKAHSRRWSNHPLCQKPCVWSELQQLMLKALKRPAQPPQGVR